MVNMARSKNHTYLNNDIPKCCVLVIVYYIMHSPIILCYSSRDSQKTVRIILV